MAVSVGTLSFELRASSRRLGADVQRGLTQTKAQVTRFERGMTSGLTRVTGAAGGTAAALGPVALGVAAVGVAFVGATMLSAKFEKTLKGVQAVTGATDKELSRLSQTAQRLGASTSFSAIQSAEAIETLAKNGLSMSSILNGAVDASLTLAAATGGDLAQSADIATDVMLAFNLAATDMKRVVDSITGVVVKSKFNIRDYGFALAQAGGVAGAVGVSIEDFNTAVAATASVFKRGSDAGTSFKTFLIRLNPESKRARDVIEDMGLKFFDASGKMRGMGEIAGELQRAFGGLSEAERLLNMQIIFGADAFRTAAIFAREGKEGFQEFKNAMSDVSAEEQQQKRLEGVSGAAVKLSSAFKGLVLQTNQTGSVVEKFLLALRDGMARITAATDIATITVRIQDEAGKPFSLDTLTRQVLSFNRKLGDAIIGFATGGLNPIGGAIDGFQASGSGDVEEKDRARRLNAVVSVSNDLTGLEEGRLRILDSQRQVEEEIAKAKNRGYEVARDSLEVTKEQLASSLDMFNNRIYTLNTVAQLEKDAAAEVQRAASMDAEAMKLAVAGEKALLDQVAMRRRVEEGLADIVEGQRVASLLASKDLVAMAKEEARIRSTLKTVDPKDVQKTVVDLTAAKKVLAGLQRDRDTLFSGMMEGMDDASLKALTGYREAGDAIFVLQDKITKLREANEGGGLSDQAVADNKMLIQSYSDQIDEQLLKKDTKFKIFSTFGEGIEKSIEEMDALDVAIRGTAINAIRIGLKLETLSDDEVAKSVSYIQKLVDNQRTIRLKIDADIEKINMDVSEFYDSQESKRVADSENVKDIQERIAVLQEEAAEAEAERIALIGNVPDPNKKLLDEANIEAGHAVQDATFAPKTLFDEANIDKAIAAWGLMNPDQLKEFNFGEPHKRESFDSRISSQELENEISLSTTSEIGMAQGVVQEAANILPVGENYSSAPETSGVKSSDFDRAAKELSVPETTIPTSFDTNVPEVPDLFNKEQVLSFKSIMSQPEGLDAIKLPEIEAMGLPDVGNMPNEPEIDMGRTAADAKGAAEAWEREKRVLAEIASLKGKAESLGEQTEARTKKAAEVNLKISKQLQKQELDRIKAVGDRQTINGAINTLKRDEEKIVEAIAIINASEAEMTEETLEKLEAQGTLLMENRSAQAGLVKDLRSYNTEWENVRESMKQTFAEGIAGGKSLRETLLNVVKEWEHMIVMQAILGEKDQNGQRSGGLMGMVGNMFGGGGGFGAFNGESVSGSNLMNADADTGGAKKGGGIFGGLAKGIGKFFGGGGIGNLFKFANGGEFQVGGSGGQDSQLVQFMASPNETVSIKRPDQMSEGGGAPVINISNFFDIRARDQDIQKQIAKSVDASVRISIAEGQNLKHRGKIS